MLLHSKGRLRLKIIGLGGSLIAPALNEICTHGVCTPFIVDSDIDNVINFFPSSLTLWPVKLVRLCEAIILVQSIILEFHIKLFLRVELIYREMWDKAINLCNGRTL
jgi:hypothetical protein